MTILPLTYLGSTAYYARLVAGGCVVDTCENWVKQTARNRCDILTANGPASLTVPVHAYGAKIAVRDVRIDNSKNWQHRHWGSIVASYGNSPFFEHYADRFAPFYERRFDFLADLDIGLTETILDALGADAAALEIPEKYVNAQPGDEDLRGKKSLRPGVDPVRTEPYTQVFCDRMDFTPGMSVIDLLFCMSGRWALPLLLRSRRY